MVKIGEAARMPGTKPDTLRKWERTGEWPPTRKTRAGTHYYSISDPMGVTHEATPSAYGAPRPCAIPVPE